MRSVLQICTTCAGNDRIKYKLEAKVESKKNKGWFGGKPSHDVLSKQGSDKHLSPRGLITVRIGQNPNRLMQASQMRRGRILMTYLPPEDMARYCSRLSGFNMGASAKETHVRALHLVIVSIIDNVLGKSSTDLAVAGRLKYSFQSSASRANIDQVLEVLQETLTVDLTSLNRSEGANNKPEIERGTAP